LDKNRKGICKNIRVSKGKENGNWRRMLHNRESEIYLPCLDVFKFGFFL
jgi:hypothetical protein